MNNQDLCVLITAVDDQYSDEVNLDRTVRMANLLIEANLSLNALAVYSDGQDFDAFLVYLGNINNLSKVKEIAFSIMKQPDFLLLNTDGTNTLMESDGTDTTLLMKLERVDSSEGLDFYIKNGSQTYTFK